jgi:hypothetical protein
VRLSRYRDGDIWVLLMIAWLLNWVRVTVGHWLLAKEEADAEARRRERERRMKDIVDAGQTVDDCIDDLDRGEF